MRHNRAGNSKGEIFSLSELNDGVNSTCLIKPNSLLLLWLLLLLFIALKGIMREGLFEMEVILMIELMAVVRMNIMVVLIVYSCCC